jgi:hypothetical protein
MSEGFLIASDRAYGAGVRCDAREGGWVGAGRQVGGYDGDQMAPHPHTHFEKSDRWGCRRARQNGAKVSDVTEVVDSVDVDGDVVAVGCDLEEGEVRPGSWLGNAAAPGLDGLHQRVGRAAEVIRKAPKDEALHRVETTLAVAEPRGPRAVGACKSMLDHGLAQLGTIDGGAIH